MLSEENESRAFDGLYERERLRRRARKLGLQLVKSEEPRLSHEGELSRSASQAESDDPDGKCNRMTGKRADLDRCG